MTTAREILVAAREILAMPERWTKEDFARDADGEPTDEWDEDAVCFCLLGSTSRAARLMGIVSGSDVEAAADDKLSAAAGRPVSEFNDDPATTHADILALFDRAIAACGEGE